MPFAIIETGGKQYKVAPGGLLKVEKLPAPEGLSTGQAGGKIIFDKVLLLDDGKATQVGAPYIAGAKVEAEYIKEGRGKKITVIHYKAKVRYKKVQGHRQPFTELKVTKIS